MTIRQWNNSVGTINFVDNINKLSKGRKTEFWRENTDGAKTLLARVRCDTVGQRPRMFMVTNSEVIPVGAYTYKGIVRNILDRVQFTKDTKTCKNK